MAPVTNKKRSNKGQSDAWMTKEQMHDVYMEGTSDGRIQLEDDVIEIKNEKED